MYQPADAALLRAAAYPRDLILPAWPDLTASQPEAWLKWLDQAWALPGFSAAITPAAPQLAAQITRALAGKQIAARKLQRLTAATVRYLLRWTTRATPFGLFAGVAPIELGDRATLTWGDQHQAVTRPDDLFIAAHMAEAEQNLAALRAVALMTNTLGYERGGKWVMPCTSMNGGRIQETEIGLTGPIRLAITTASSPVMFGDLAASLIAAYPASQAAAEQLIAEMVSAQVLLSAIRPPMTVTDPAAHLARHKHLPDPGDQAATDLRLDCAMTLPAQVAREACQAASALAAVAPHLPGWAAYHAAFTDRWGPGAAVPLREVLRVLGFPAGYLGSARREQPPFTGRDLLLAELAQRSALTGCAEVVLDDGLIGRLRQGDSRPPVPHTELRFTLAAATIRDLDRGAFTLTVVSGARHAGVAAGRFLHLLTPDELARFRRVYANLPSAMPGAATVQVSAAPLEARLATVARAPELLPVLPAGDFHSHPAMPLADLAVAADGQRLWLTSLATGRPVEPLLFNAVLPELQQPVVRFVTEIWTAWTAPCARFDWGHARGLPFLPRIRRGKSILHPARWIIPHTVLPRRTATWPEWLTAWHEYHEQNHLPGEVLAGDGDMRLRLDLTEQAHLAVLRSHLDKSGHVVATEADGPAGWTAGRPAELLLTLTHLPSQPAAPRPSRLASTTCHRPGHSTWLDAHLYGRCGTVLTRLDDPVLDLPDGWWFLHYPDPALHVRIRIPLREPGEYGAVARRLAQWAELLQDDGLLYDYTLHIYRPETRYGTGPALTAAETVFAADSRAAITSLTRMPADRQAATAAGMITIAEAFTGDGSRWLAERVPHRSGPRLDPRQLAAARAPYGDDQLTAALATYRILADQDGLDADQVLADLLHLNHTRMIGVDTGSERHCLRIARAVARADLARRT